MIDQSQVSIIVPHLGNIGDDPENLKQRSYSLHKCLRSLLDTCSSRIIVSQNGGTMPLFFPSFIDKERVNWIHNWDQGQAKAVNAAVATTNTPWILVTNDDMIFSEGWFERLQIWGGKGEVGIVDLSDIQCISPKLVEPRPGAPTFSVFACGGAGGDFDYDKWQGYAQDYYEHTYRIRTGFNLPFLIRRDVWDTVGGYDIQYDPFSSNSDSDLEYKLKLAGVQPYQNPNAIVYHFSQTSGTFHPDNQSYWQKNWEYFIAKWGFPRTDEGIWEATFKIPDEGRIFRPDYEGKYGAFDSSERVL